MGHENPFADNLPDYDWVASFLKLHPELISFVPKQLKKSPAKSAANKRIFDEWFQLLKTTLEENNLIDMPERIYNVDKSAFRLTGPQRLFMTPGFKTSLALHHIQLVQKNLMTNPNGKRTKIYIRPKPPKEHLNNLSLD